MFGNPTRIRAIAHALLIWAILININLQAAPIRLTSKLVGTNQIEFSFGPVVSGVSYEILARTNGPEGHWIGFAVYEGTSNGVVIATHSLGGPGEMAGLKMETIHNWTFTVCPWADPFGNELPPYYVELVLRGDPYIAADPYGDPMHDGRSNLQKFRDNMDPLKAEEPPQPRGNLRFNVAGATGRFGKAILTIENGSGVLPDYIDIEKATLALRVPVTNQLNRSRMPDPRGVALMTNRPPFRGPQFAPNPYWPRENSYITNDFNLVARIRTKPGIQTYTYTETNVDILMQPLYRFRAHFPPPYSSSLTQLNSNSIRRTLLQIQSRQTTNGYELTAYRPIPHGRYLLLVRDKSERQWRASGYFTAGTNSDPVHLQVDFQGMMGGGQTPIAMPEVKLLRPVIDPEFTAGWGEDSDGDGLPDIYEVLVTGTDPVNADTGATGVLDGYKDMSGDGWNSLEKFRRRADPLRVAVPPPVVELVRPTLREICNAITPKTDLHCEMEIAVQTNAAIGYQPIEQIPWMLSEVLSRSAPDARKDFDVRVSWHFSEPSYESENLSRSPGEPSWYGAIEPLIQRVNLKIMTAFEERLHTNPPIAWGEASNQLAAIVGAYRQGEMDKGLAMSEIMLIGENTAQEFYGRVVEQHGQPIADVTVTATPTRDGSSGSANAQTDGNGFFQFVGLRGRSVSIALRKSGYEIRGHGVGLRNANGPETSETNRALFTMWKLKGAEPMIHHQNVYQFKPDNRAYTIDLLSNKTAEGTNGPGDLLVRLQRPSQVQRNDKYEWTFGMTAIGGGVIQVTNDDYLNEAPPTGYQSDFTLDVPPSNPNWRAYVEETFYLKSREGRAYGHIHLKIYPESPGGSSIDIESYINPSATRNLEFDPTREIRKAP